MDLVNQLQQEGLPVFRKIFDTYHHRVYNYIYGKTKSEYMAEEVVQLTFIKIWERRMSLPGHIEMVALIFQIANTTLIDMIRKYERKNHLMVFGEGTHELESAQVLPLLFLKETQQKLNNLIESLPPTRREVFRMSRFEEMSHKEIANKLSISPKTVENHINLALKYIRPFFSHFLSVFLIIIANLFKF
ncbi:RNA polymerase sigma-70 factor [Arachidicoccus ginsenosidivorans]|jgi:RNA polymerase sigma-70 factor (ECF subfamily)|uniref:RNA polymerase sigma-70 factor n=1 Tax=Arachidicoccus ginsenosidivorans TaxID=496057 RepID=A0A5B8VK36_9BACT|nr:RNA polymerase sigma-70 factor [Arachidicoccus ginsenosidivorans]QEC70986.1 RNA polymerase sigma-70 factor [Arachidicoccus ginsenosidivorans]